MQNTEILRKLEEALDQMETAANLGVEDTAILAMSMPLDIHRKAKQLPTNSDLKNAVAAIDATCARLIKLGTPPGRIAANHLGLARNRLMEIELPPPSNLHSLIPEHPEDTD